MATAEALKAKLAEFAERQRAWHDTIANLGDRLNALEEKVVTSDATPRIPHADMFKSSPTRDQIFWQRVLRLESPPPTTNPSTAKIERVVFSGYKGGWDGRMRQGKGEQVIYKQERPVARYNGEWLDDEYNGKGEIMYYDGSESFSGRFRLGKREGYGVRRLKDVVFEGDFLDGDFSAGSISITKNNDKNNNRIVQFDRQQTSVSIKYQDDRSYVGHVNSSWLPDGTGKMIYSDGTKFVGEFAKGVPRIGTLTRPTSHRFVGTVRITEDMPAPEYGIESDPSGDYFEGYWDSEGYRQGPGVESRAKGGTNDGPFEVFGRWRDNILITSLVLDTNRGVYYGDLNDDRKPTGRGVMWYNNGEIYVGNWQDGKERGKGTILNADGDVIRRVTAAPAAAAAAAAAAVPVAESL